jgi:hypothetical protein
LRVVYADDHVTCAVLDRALDYDHGALGAAGDSVRY